MKKIFITILINIIILISVIFIFELTLEIKEFVHESAYLSPEEKAQMTFADYFKRFYDKNYCRFFEKSDGYYCFREPNGLDKYKNKPGVVIMGCSFAYGIHLDNEDTFAAVLSKLTHRPVYNLSIIGGSQREMLHILRDKNLLDDILSDKNNIEYLIYIYIPDHQNRNFLNIHFHTPYFKKIDNDLKEIKKNRIIQHSMLKKVFDEFMLKNYSDNKKWEEFCYYMNVIKKQINKELSYKGKNTKLVIFVYKENGTEKWDALKDDNTEIIHLNDIYDANTDIIPYIVWEGNVHPSAFAWQKITPAFVKRLGLQL